MVEIGLFYHKKVKVQLRKLEREFYMKKIHLLHKSTYIRANLIQKFLRLYFQGKIQLVKSFVRMSAKICP